MELGLVTREAFASARRRMADEFALSGDGRQVARAYAEDADAILADLWERTADGRPSGGAALVAVGGYGRAELAPYSDLDVMLLHRGRSDIEELNRALFYPLWDAGVDVGNRVRDPGEVLRSLQRLDEAAAILDARLIAGDRGLFLELLAAVDRTLARSRAGLLKRLGQAVHDRHSARGHAGHLLEPEIRDGAGGLRDIHCLRWAARIWRDGGDLTTLEAGGIISGDDRLTLDEADGFLWRARVAMHVHDGRRQDKLLLVSQDDIARSLGYAEGETAAGDAFMRDLYRHARGVDAISAFAWERLLGSGRRRRRSRVASEGLVVGDGRLDVVAAPAVDEDPAGWLRALTICVREGVKLGRPSLHRLGAQVATARAIAWTPEARRIFTELLEAGDEARPAFDALDSSRLLDALIEGWDVVRCLPQRNLYHRLTVDMHLFATVGELARSRTADDPAVADAWERAAGDTEPLWWAALLHDAGKGRGGDHSEIGAGLAAETARRAGLPETAVEDVRMLVSRHLLLAELAVRRDVAEPATVSAVTEAVGTARRLAMLFLLTRADSLATGPEAWSPLRAALVRELYARALAAFEGRPAGRPSASIADAELTDSPLAPDEVRTRVREDEGGVTFVVVAHDRPGLFAAVSGVLAARGIEVHSAEAHTRPDGIAVECFRTSAGAVPVPAERWQRVGHDVREALSGRLDLDEALRRKARHAPLRAPGARGAEVVIDNRSAPGSTVIEVHARDAVGLLRRLSGALTRAGCDISKAKVATYGTEVVDVFWVRDARGMAITDAAALEDIRAALTKAAQA